MRPVGLLAFLTVAVIASAAGPSPAQGGSHGPDPKRIVLQLADLPRGFARTKGRYVSNALLTKREHNIGIVTLYPKDYINLGRLNGYEVFYERASTRLGAVSSTATTYKTARGAHKSFLVSVAEMKGNAGRFKQVPLAAPLGDEALLMWNTSAPRGALEHRKVWDTDVYIVLWRQGRVLAEVYAQGEMGHNPRTTIALVRKQKARIVRATR